MTYTFLELFRVSNKKSLNIQNIGDTIGYFRKQHLVNIVKYTYTCAINRVSFDDVVAKLGYAA